MYINATGYYIPSQRIPNDYYMNLNGLDDAWITKRTGIKTRSRAGENEDQNSMAIAAVEDAIKNCPYDIKDVDLIIAASYTVYDTVATVAHIIQQKYDIDQAKALYMSSACSSFINGLEVAQCFFAAGKAKKALIISSEHNSKYANETDPKSGHLWGDGAVAFFLSADKVADSDHEIMEIYTMGLGNIGKGPEGVQLKPKDGGIAMPYGKDVFVNACNYMVNAINHVLEPHGLKHGDLGSIMCHQANKRIVTQVAHLMEIPDEVFINNIEELGNTGSASSAIVYAQNVDKLAKDSLSALSVFGGGYSCGAALIKN